MKRILQSWVERFIFVIIMWLLSRLVIVVAMEVMAPSLPSSPAEYNYNPPPLGFIPGFIAKPGWELFTHWDGAYYRQITTVGYDYANDGKEHSIAFFPLFPLIARGLMTLGLPFDVAGTLVNNFAFLGALLLLYLWAEERYDVSVARWSTAVLAWCPFSLFGTVAYTEGLFLLLTTAALRAFGNRQHVWAAIWSAMATATRPTGIALVPTFLFVAWRERRPTVAYAAGFATAGGLILFSLYCAIRFGDPLAFVHAQKGWQHLSWWELFASVLKFNRDSLNKIVILFSSIYLLWHLRAKLPPVAVAFGVFTIALILYSGALTSLSRYIFGTVSVSLALGILLASHRRWGYLLLGLFAVYLEKYAIRFAWWVWLQ
jgi:Gpi18-like mannosyltransferase